MSQRILQTYFTLFQETENMYSNASPGKKPGCFRVAAKFAEHIHIRRHLFNQLLLSAFLKDFSGVFKLLVKF